MANWYPARRILGFPAWLWVALPVLLLWLGNLIITKNDSRAPDSDLLLPSKPEEPSDRREVSREIRFLLVVRDGDSFRFVPFSDRKHGTPLWQVLPALIHEEEYGSRGWELLHLGADPQGGTLEL
jgi:hypothetical protein